LRFRVGNHRSIRDEAEISLVSTSFKGAAPPDGDWSQATLRVLGIYGPNASGKSNLLDAIDFACTAVRQSATAWGDSDHFKFQPFRLDVEAARKPSLYEFDLVIHGIRYTYGFLSNREGVQREWLYSFPHGRRRRLFERESPDASDMEFSRELAGENVRIARLTRPNALFLSVAANSNHKLLTAIQRHIGRDISYARYSYQDQSSRMYWTRKLLEQPVMLLRAQSLLRLADFGIQELRLHEEELDEKLRSLFRHLWESLNEGAPDAEETSQRDAQEIIHSEVEFVERVQKSLRFMHAGKGDDYSFAPHEESSGTLAWLSLAVPALFALDSGQTLMVDELDASLHPRLSAALIAMFKDEAINRSAAQLVFTSHDATLLGRFSQSPLATEEVWFCEKNDTGATEIYALAEFSTRSEDNFERRYLQGRYGAVPMISSQDLRKAVDLTPDMDPAHAE
jgi:predicted ATP-dependent endonuclease of OLD family